MRALLTLLLLPVASSAQTAADPLQTPACRQALQQLQSVEARMAADRSPMPHQAVGASQPRAPQAIPPALQRARRQAAHACLGTRLDAPLPEGRLAQPPVTVAPAAGNTTIPRLPRSLPGVPQPAPRVPATPLNSITSCDANGCWSSDGTRLQRQGGALLGPRGYCTTTAGVVTCP